MHFWLFGWSIGCLLFVCFLFCYCLCVCVCVLCFVFVCLTSFGSMTVCVCMILYMHLWCLIKFDAFTSWLHVCDSTGVNVDSVKIFPCVIACRIVLLWTHLFLYWFSVWVNVCCWFHTYLHNTMQMFTSKHQHTRSDPNPDTALHPNLCLIIEIIVHL